MQETILVVEDDPMIRQLVKIYLEKEHYIVIEAKDGREAQEQFQQHHPCLIVLDLMLPKLSGENFFRWVKDQSETVSVVMLSAKAQTEDKISGLKLGADAYVTKPFNPEELTAQIEAVLRRTGHFCQKVVRSGLVIKPRRGEVLLNGQSIHLTKHEFNLLYHMMQHPNIVFSREQLVEQIYPLDEQDILDRTIDAHIKKLRVKIETVPAQPERIITVRGMGYKFVDN